MIGRTMLGAGSGRQGRDLGGIRLHLVSLAETGMGADRGVAPKGTIGDLVPGARRDARLTGWVRTRPFVLILLLLLGMTFAPVRGMAQTGPAETGSVAVAVQPVSLAEAAMASCAGGAMIGYLLVVATGPGSPTATAAMFCGLSAAATVASSITFWTWRSLTGWLP